MAVAVQFSNVGKKFRRGAVHESLRDLLASTGRRIIEVARDRGVLDDEQLARLLDPLAMAHARPADG